MAVLNTLRPRQNRRHFTDDIFKCILLNETIWISLKISLMLVPKVLINNNPALVQIMAWRRQGDKPLSELKMISLLTHICITRPQWVKRPKTSRQWKYVGYSGRWYSPVCTLTQHGESPLIDPETINLATDVILRQLPNIYDCTSRCPSIYNSPTGRLNHTCTNYNVN